MCRKLIQTQILTARFLGNHGRGFQENEQLISESELTFGTTLIEIGSPFAQLLPVDATAVAAVAYINEGIYFIRGHFVNVPSAYIILDQYTNLSLIHI